MSKKYYYSIRVVKARSLKGAIKNVCDENFQEQLSICDCVLTIKQLETIVKTKKLTQKCNRKGQTECLK